jgi:hypothetical protein
MEQRSFKTYLRGKLGVVAAVFVLFAGYCAYLGAGPDRQLHFEREVPTSLPAETLGESIGSVSNWPEWFYSVFKAERVDLMGRPLATASQTAEKGALIRLEIRPHKGERRGSFELLVEITEHVPQKLIAMRLVQDGSGRINKVVEGLEWRIELLGDKIRGTATARTRHWRSRVIGALSERVLMNQLFYPNVMALGLFTQPHPPNPFPAYGS